MQKKQTGHMRYICIFLLFFILDSCSQTSKISHQSNSSLYLIKNIESKNDWFIILANRNDSTFMIVSKKPDVFNPNWEKIKADNYYSLSLRSIIPVINGVKMIPMNYLDFEGINLDERTIVNINPEKGIYDIYSASNLRGLSIVK